MDVRLEIAPYDFAAARGLEAALGVSHTVGQVLARRGLTDPARARAFLDAQERHGLDDFGGLREAAEVVLGHVAAGSIVTVHGDYDVDGVASTAILVRALRSLGARVDWYLPSRSEDGYGLSAATVERLAARGTRLLLTTDCAITAVEEVDAARAAGLDVVVTDHHAPRADGRLPDAPIVHPRLNGGNPCGDLCAAGVAYKLAGALLEAAGLDPALADEDLDLVALATVADVVPLHGENRALVRAGLRALAATSKPGLRALMAVARVDPSALDSSSIGFRLAPRINAAGRLARADAGLELLLTTDPDRAREIAEELDRCNMDRRDVETRILFAAEAQVAAYPGPPSPAAYVLWADDWHPGVIGIVAARIAERHHRPTVLIAMDAEAGTGSGRSIPAFDLLGGLQSGAEHLLRHGGHRAAAGLTIERSKLEAFRAAFQAHAAAVLAPEDLVPSERIDAVVPGDALGLPLAEELALLEPFGAGNPAVSLLVPAATLEDPRPMGEGRHVAFTLVNGGSRSRAVRFGSGGRLPAEPGALVDAAVRLEANAFNGTVEPRLVLRRARPVASGSIELVGEPDSFAAGLLAEVDRPLEPWPCPAPAAGPATARELRDVRGAGLAGTIADLVATGEPVLAVSAHTHHRARALSERLGGFALTCWAALAEEPDRARGYAHVVALDPPPHAALVAGLEHLPGDGWAHLAWGEPELRFAAAIHEWEYTLREPLAAVYRALRAAGGSRGEACEAVLRGEGTQPRTAAMAGRLVRVLTELGLADLDRTGVGLSLAEAPARTALERSAAFTAYGTRLESGKRYLTTSIQAAA